MMPDIFSSFDPSSFNYVLPLTTMTFLVNILYFTVLDRNVWGIEMSRMMPILMMYKTLMPELDRTYMFNINPLLIIMPNIFLTIIVLNMMGLFPYTFSITSHLIFTLSFGFPMWLMLILSSMTKLPKASIAHFLPEGAPNWLNPFLVLIESSSIIVRPITLSFRLAANMSAGHIVIGLIGIYAAAAWFNSFIALIMLFMVTVGYILFEVAICTIQSYIFFLLLSLYANDHAH